MEANIYSLIPIDSAQPMQQTNFFGVILIIIWYTFHRCRPTIKWIMYLLIMAFVIGHFGGFASADIVASDTVHYRQQQVRQLKGTIVDFNGQGLTIMLTSGQKRVIPAEQVIRIDSQRTPAQRAARLATKAGQFEKAASNYYRLLESGAEDRNWVQCEIRSELVLALRADGKHFQASKAFLQLFHKDPGTPYMHCIPLIWAGGFTPSPQAEATAVAWMEDLARPIAQLLGSSLLLGTRKSQQAERVLLNLAETAIPPLNALARAQWLRTQLPYASADKIELCRKTVEQLPLSLQGGPYYILSRLYERTGENRKAAVAAMRVAILDDANPNLAAEALLTAWKVSVEARLPTEAKKIYTELINTYPQSTAAAEAKQRKEDLD